MTDLPKNKKGLAKKILSFNYIPTSLNKLFTGMKKILNSDPFPQRLNGIKSSPYSKNTRYQLISRYSETTEGHQNFASLRKCC